MTTKDCNVSSRRFTYGYAEAEFPDLQSVLWKAKEEYERICDLYPGQIKERFDQALQKEETSVWLKLTRIG